MNKNFLILNRQFNEINPVIAGWEDCKRCHAYGPAIREYYLIHFVVSGKGKFRRKNQTIKLQKNTMFLIRPHEITYYIADNKEPWSYIWIGFDGRLPKEILELTDFKDNTAVIYAPFLRNLFVSIKEADHLNISTEIFLCGKIYEMFSILQEEYSKKGQIIRTPYMYVKYAKDYMTANYTESLKISKIAGMLGIDRRYLCRIFKDATRVTPQQYLITLRLKKAAELLRSEVYTVGEVSRMSGYEDIFNFSKMFKKHYGVSPMNYKKGS